MSKKVDADPGPSPIPADPPISPELVKKASGKAPKEFDWYNRMKALETSQSKLEDQVSGLDGAIKGINEFLQGIGGGKSQPARGGQEKGVLEDIANDILGDD